MHLSTFIHTPQNRNSRLPLAELSYMVNDSEKGIYADLAEVTRCGHLIAAGVAEAIEGKCVNSGNAKNFACVADRGHVVRGACRIAGGRSGLGYKSEGTGEESDIELHLEAITK